jgi:hypothetical protein
LQEEKYRRYLSSRANGGERKMRRIILGIAVFMVITAFDGAAAIAQSSDIQWQVSNRFRLWDQARSSTYLIGHDAFLDHVQTSTGPAQLHRDILTFLSAQGDLHEKAYWTDGSEIYSRAYIWPAYYSVRVWLPGADQCDWTAVDMAGSGQTRPRVISPQGKCGLGTLIEIPTDETGSGSRTVTVTATRQDGVTLQEEIRVRDTLIASIGDSFASGEGNPDRPTDLTRLARRFGGETPWDDEWVDRWPGRDPVIGAAGAAEWWDPRCHRSFLSQHMVAALRYAAAHPQEATTFVSYACSGAQVFGGLLSRQAQPPGYRDSRAAEVLQYPQVEVLVANMCRRNSVVGRTMTYDVTAFEERRRNGAGPPDLEAEDVRRQVQGYRCEEDAPRRIDMLLVSIGGNDVGFGPVIQHGLLPLPEERSGLGRRVLNILRDGRAAHPATANHRIEHALPSYYALLRERLDDVLPPQTRIFQTVYPNPLEDETGALCGPEEPHDWGSGQPDHHSIGLLAIDGYWPRIDAQYDPARRWPIALTQSEARDAQTLVIDPLNAAVRLNVEAGGSRWTLVDGFEDAFSRRGWCATGVGETLTLPNWSEAEGAWRDWPPQSWDPYRPRARLFRTPNDAVLTQQPSDPRRMLGFASGLFNNRLSQRQEALMAAMAGSFHPTFEAHVIMGWRLGQALIESPSPDPD